jgi:hypothetical protein
MSVTLNLQRTARWPAAPSPMPGEIDPVPAYAAFIGMAGLLATSVAFTEFTADASLFTGLLQLAILLISACLLRKLGLSRLAHGIEMTTLFTGFCACATLMSLMLAATSLPLADPILAAADRAIFGPQSWPWLLRIARACPAAMTWLSLVYDTLLFQPLLLISMLLMARADRRLGIFILAWMIALLLTLAVAPFAPAVAAYLYFGVDPHSIPGLRLHVAWEHVVTLRAVRDGSFRHLGVDSLYGIITFPSFHAAGAVLLGYGFQGFRLLRWPFTMLNAALFVSAIFVGGHFLVDLVAGAAIAVFAIFLGSRIVDRRCARHSGSTPRRADDRVRIRRANQAPAGCGAFAGSAMHIG